MIDPPSTIGPLTKVSLRLMVSAPDFERSKSKEGRYEFIYGIGSQGITPFEKALFGKQSGERVIMEIGDGQLSDVFGHLTCRVTEAVACMTPCRLEAVVTSLATVDPPEVVKAMAQVVGCAGCDCGC